MKRLEQLAKGIDRTRQEANLNTRRVQANFPLVERKLDILAANDHNFHMEFPLTKNNHSALLTLRLKPDNCCECEPGAATVGRECIGYYQGGKIGPSGNYQYGVAYPAIYTGESEPFWKYNVWVPEITRTARGLVQTGVNFNYGYESPFVVPIFQAFDAVAGYSIAPNGRIKIPADGVYTICFQCNVNGTVDTGSSYMIASIKVDHLDESGNPVLDTNGDPWIETLSRKVWSVEKKNLWQGDRIPNEMNIYHIIMYASCVNLNKGDTIGGWLEINDISGFHAAGGWLGDGTEWGDDSNSTSVNLLGRGYGVLIGYVYDFETGDPIQGATMHYANGFGGSTTTDEFGAYAFYTLHPGTYTVTASKSGYSDQSQVAYVYFNKVTQLDYHLYHV